MKRLDDPVEFARVQAQYFEGRFISDLPNEELMDRENTKRNLIKNQSR